MRAQLLVAESAIVRGDVEVRPQAQLGAKEQLPL
jgi:hypothetical protein